MIRRLLILATAVLLVLKAFPVLGEWITVQAKRLTGDSDPATHVIQDDLAGDTAPAAAPPPTREPFSPEPSRDHIRAQLERLTRGGRDQ